MKKITVLLLGLALGGLVLCVVGGVVVSDGLGINSESAALPRVYAEAKARGLPLTSADLEADTPRSASRFGEFSLLVEPFRERIGRAEDWLPGGEIERKLSERALVNHRKALEDLVTWVERNDHFRGPRDLSIGMDELYPEVSRSKNAVSFLTMLAVVQALEGKPREAEATLRAAGKLTREVTAKSSLVHGLVQVACWQIIERGALCAMEVDPRNAATYADAASQGWDFNPAYHLKGEVYIGVWEARNRPEQRGLRLPFRIPFGTAAPAQSSSERGFRTSGLPSDPLNRGMMAVWLRYWNRVYGTADETGRFPDWKHTQALADAELNQLQRSRRPPDRLATIYLRELDHIFSGFERARTGHRLTAALGQVLSFRDRTGRWPRTLDEAGVKPIPDPNAPGKFAQYRADAAGVSIWTSGRDGDDDGGIIESTASGSPDRDFAVGLPVKRIGLPIERRRSRPAGSPAGSP